MHGRGGQLEPGGQVGEAQPAGPLEGKQDADGSVDALDHAPLFREETLDGTVSDAYSRHVIRHCRIIFDFRSKSLDTPMGVIMDENTRSQKLAAEVLGTALLVFIGVGSVPATLIVNGERAVHDGRPRHDLLAFGTVVVATVYALGHVSGNHINPAVTLGLAVTGKFPWKQVPAYIAAQVVGATIGAFAIIGVLGPGRTTSASAWRRSTARWASGTCKASSPSSSARSSWCS